MNQRPRRLNHEPDYDDLTIIKGIGQARQQWLREQMSVRTMDDLAALTANDIETLLRAEGRIISRGEIDAWLEEARQFATAHVAPANAPDHAPATVEDTPQESIAASFVIEVKIVTLSSGTPQFVTIAHHIETDMDETWDALVPPELQRWMIQRVQVDRAVETTTHAWDEAVIPSTAAGSMQFGAFSERLGALLARSGDPLPESTSVESALAGASPHSEGLTPLLSRAETPLKPGGAAKSAEEAYQFSPRLQQLMAR